MNALSDAPYANPDLMASAISDPEAFRRASRQQSVEVMVESHQRVMARHRHCRIGKVTWKSLEIFS